MKSGTVSLDQISKLLDTKLKPIKAELSSHTKTLEAHTASLAEIENYTKPMAEVSAELIPDHTKRIGKIEGLMN